MPLVQAQKCTFCDRPGNRVVTGRWNYRFADGTTCESAYFETVRVAASSSKW
jgi:hypothetical protein